MQRAQQRVGHRRHRVGRLAAATTDRVAPIDGMLDQRAPHHRQREHAGDLLALDQVEQCVGIEAAHAGTASRPS